jgi:hypothetical protein
LTAVPTLAASALALWGGVPAGAQEPLRAYTVDPDASALWVVTHRSGLLGFLGHEHAIIPLEWSASLCAADPLPRSAHGSVVIGTASLVIDSDSARALADLGDGPGEDDRLEIQEKLLDPERLDAEGHPEIELRVDSVAPEREGSVVGFGRLTIRGVTLDVAVPLQVDRDPDSRLTLAGQVRVRQTDFGIEPESVARVVNVADEVDLHVRLVAARGEEACEPGDRGAPRGRARSGSHSSGDQGARRPQQPRRAGPTAFLRCRVVQELCTPREVR